MIAPFFARWLSLILPASAGKVADKPAPCRWCGANVGVEHVIRRPHRYAQVACPTCGTSGPAVRFEPSDEWPHIAAEQSAVAKWDAMHRRWGAV